MKNIKKHPVFNHSEDIQKLCRPLEKLGISYFSHVNIDANNQFSALCNHPVFAEYYLRNEYYNADIHLASDLENLGSFILWDVIEIGGEGQKMSQAASEMGLKHTFTIIQKKEGTQECDFYHFSSHLQENSINQIYINSLDILNNFILNFNEEIQNFTDLRKAYDYKFSLDLENSEFNIVNSHHLNELQTNRGEIISCINSQNQYQQSYQNCIQHRESKKIIKLAPQQFKCLNLWLKSYTAKEIAKILQLSPRTVEAYLLGLRKTLTCQTGRDMIKQYISLSP